MIIFKPEWIVHKNENKKNCIFSMDVSPDGTQLATGSSDGTIKIWNTLPIYNEEAEQDFYCQKLLTTLEHGGSVLCLRWSNHPAYLASSSDRENTVIIWKNQNQVWKPEFQLTGHVSDVQGIAWSKDDEYLASCSLDGTIIIWDGQTFEQVKKIDRQEGSVNGIVWDPAGKYLASQSDDKTVKIWRTTNWTLDTTIKNPFLHTSTTTLFNRLSWSPEGQHLATANATNSQKPVAAIVAREDWNSDISLVGHKYPVEITSFNPKLFYINEDSSIDGVTIKSISSICALGSQDRSVSIWVTKSSKPICVAVDIFNDNIYDIVWAPDGRSLFACSCDGTVACLQFQEELDDDVPDSVVIPQLIKFGYGKHLKKQPCRVPTTIKTPTTEIPTVETPTVETPTMETPTMETFTVETPTTVDTPTNKSAHRNSLTQTNLDSFTQPASETNIPSNNANTEVPRSNKRAISDDEEETRLTRTKPNWAESSVIPPIVKTSQVQMALPKIKSMLSAKGKNSTFLLECLNTPSNSNTIQAKITGTDKTILVWTDYLSSLVTLTTTNTSFSAVSCEDGSIHTWSPSGKRILPAIVLDSPLVLLQSVHSWLVCITATGLLYSWDLLNLRNCLEGVSIAPILHVAQLDNSKTHDAPSIKSIRVQKDGLPILITSSHQAFVYHLKMKVWLRVSDAWYILSEFWGTSARKEDHPLAWLSLNNQGPISNQTLLDMSAATKVVTISHIETQLAVAALLDSPLEYKDWMIYYVRRLSEENAKYKVEELCKWLVGPPYIPSTDLVKWEPTILGNISKKDLLGEILPLLAKNRQLQRTLQEFSSFAKRL